MRTNIKKKIRNSLSSKRFSTSIAALRSDSDNGEYLEVVRRILRSDKKFQRFKKDRVYRKILEHVTFDQGEQYLKIAQDQDINTFHQALQTSLVEDTVGDPFKYKFSDHSEPLSPTTLRYVKVSQDIIRLFGKNLTDVAEIGAGYGGQALVNDRLVGVINASLFDMPIINELIRRYIESFVLNGACNTYTINCVETRKYDLAISNYAFSELPAVIQHAYVKKILSQSRAGYLTMNSGKGGYRSKGKLSLDELREVLPKFEIMDEVPLTSRNNYLIVWGH